MQEVREEEWRWLGSLGEEEKRVEKAGIVAEDGSDQPDSRLGWKTGKTKPKTREYVQEMEMGSPVRSVRSLLGRVRKRDSGPSRRILGTLGRVGLRVPEEQN